MIHDLLSACVHALGAVGKTGVDGGVNVRRNSMRTVWLGARFTALECRETCRCISWTVRALPPSPLIIVISGGRVDIASCLPPYRPPPLPSLTPPLQP